MKISDLSSCENNLKFKGTYEEFLYYAYIYDFFSIERRILAIERYQPNYWIDEYGPFVYRNISTDNHSPLQFDAKDYESMKHSTVSCVIRTDNYERFCQFEPLQFPDTKIIEKDNKRYLICDDITISVLKTHEEYKKKEILPPDYTIIRKKGLNICVWKNTHIS